MPTKTASRMRYVGLDVHAETITAAVAEPDGSVRELGTIANRPEAVRKLFAKLGDRGLLRVCYEAGPTGYALYWQLAGLWRDSGAGGGRSLPAARRSPSAPGTPRLWKRQSVKFGPLWQSTHSALPMKRRRPRCASIESADASPASQRS